MVGIPQCSRQPPQQGIIKLKLSVVLRLRNSAINILELCSWTQLSFLEIVWSLWVLLLSFIRWNQIGAWLQLITPCNWGKTLLYSLDIAPVPVWIPSSVPSNHFLWFSPQHQIVSSHMLMNLHRVCSIPTSPPAPSLLPLECPRDTSHSLFLLSSHPSSTSSVSQWMVTVP